MATQKQFLAKLWNRLTVNKSVLVALLPATSDKFRRWMAIYPNVVKSVSLLVPEHKYSIYEFELEIARMQDYAGDEDLIMQNEKRIYVMNEEHLYLALEQQGVDPSLFDTPWKYEYPL